MKNNPIVTVKLVNVTVSGYIGPNTRISLEVLGLGRKIDVGTGAKNKFLCQKAWDSTTAPPIKVQVNIVERDPVYDDYLIPAPVDITLNVPTAKPYSTTNESPPYYKSGTQSKTFHVLRRSEATKARQQITRSTSGGA